MKDTICTVVGCFRKPKCRGYCLAHYQRWKRGKQVDAPMRGRISRERPCEQFGCSRKQVARGLCGTHYQRLSRIKKGQGSTPMHAPLRRAEKLVRLPGTHAHPKVAELVRKKAAETGLTVAAVQREVLKLWAEGLLRPTLEEDIHG